MDIYGIINSQSVGNYLKEIKYSFSPLQAAFLIWYSRRLTVKEKHAMWEELIATTPDEPIEARRNTVPQASLHEYLRQYMAIDNRMIELFYAAEDSAVYTYDFYCKGDHGWCDDHGFFKTAEDCFQNLQEHADLGILQVKLTKQYLNVPDKAITLYMTLDRETFYIDVRGILSEQQDKIYYDVFEGLWFEFPLPFKKGDILQPAACPYDVSLCRRDDDSAILLEDDLTPPDWRRKRYQESGDNSDMTVYGLFCNEMGKVFHECEWTYLDYEWQYKPLQEEEQALLPLSNYLKGKIPLDVLCNAYHILLSEWHVAKMRRYMYITEEWQELTGLNKKP